MDTAVEQSSGAVWKSRRPSWAPVPNKPTVSVDVKQHSTKSHWRSRSASSIEYRRRLVRACYVTWCLLRLQLSDLLTFEWRESLTKGKEVLRKSSTLHQRWWRRWSLLYINRCVRLALASTRTRAVAMVICLRSWFRRMAPAETSRMTSQFRDRCQKCPHRTTSPELIGLTVTPIIRFVTRESEQIYVVITTVLVPFFSFFLGGLLLLLLLWMMLVALLIYFCPYFFCLVLCSACVRLFVCFCFCFLVHHCIVCI